MVHPARPFVVTFCDGNFKTAYKRAEVDPQDREVGDFSREDDAFIRDRLEDDRIVKVLHNPRYDLDQLEAKGYVINGPVIDTMIVAHTITCGGELAYGLKPISKKYLDYPDTDEKELAKSTHAGRRRAKQDRWAYATEELGGKSPWRADYWLAEEAILRKYAVGDVERTQLLFQLWFQEAYNDPRMRKILIREHKLMWTLQRMERRGVRVYPGRVRKLRLFYNNYIQKQMAIVKEEGGEHLNPNSPPQMGVMFYETRGHVPNYTETFNEKLGRHNYQLNGEHLLKLANGYKHNGKAYPPDRLAKATLEAKAARQTISTFLDVYERYWVQEDDIYVLHTSYRQCGTKTGRLSAGDPNLMQVASETTGRRKADIQSRPREAFGPRPGCYWYLPDYSQIEVWVFAYLSGEKKMQKSLLAGIDFHGDIARQVFGKYPDFKEHAEYYRKCAKLIMFAKLYGGGAGKMAALLKTDIENAKAFIARYEAALPGVKLFMERTINRATREGFLINPFGRKYEFEHDFAYKGVNYLIQGTSADIMKNACVNVDRMLQTRWNDEPRLLLTIHDELVIEVPKHLHSLQLMKDIVRAMQRDSARLGLPVPLPVEMKIVKPGQRWNTTVKFDKNFKLKKAA